MPDTDRPRIDPEDAQLLARVLVTLAENPRAALIDEEQLDPVTLEEFGASYDAARRVLAATEPDTQAQEPAPDPDEVADAAIMRTLRAIFREPAEYADGSIEDYQISGADLVDWLDNALAAPFMFAPYAEAVAAGLIADPPTEQE